MRCVFLTFFLAVSIAAANAQVKAVTENGDEVILNKDGTWRSASVTPSYETRLDTAVITKSAKATFLLKGKRIKYGIWIDPKKWSFSSAKPNEETPIEYRITLKNGDAYAMTIPEGIGIGLDNIVNFTLENTKKTAPDARVVRESTVSVNGNIMRLVEKRATVQGIKFVYFAYYYSTDDMTIQFITYTSESLWNKHKGDMEELLSGFTTKID